jgi:glutathione S-transferase
MILRSASASPFVRKVRITAAVLGLDRNIEIVAADTADPNDPLRHQNPLGKIPALVLDDGNVIYDSRVIVEYLGHLAGGGRVIPMQPVEMRFDVLRLQALADGIMDASVLLVYEARWRDAAKHEKKWIDHQAGKVERALAVLEASPPSVDRIPHIGQIAIACALGYRDLRFAETWRGTYPRLMHFLEEFAAAVPAFEATRAQV